MRGAVYTILVCLALLAGGCKKFELPMANVRFENIMIDHYEFPYGLMFGDAVYGGSLGYNEITPYHETQPGTYSILARRVGGDWVTISEGKFTVLADLKYTILIYGTLERFSFQLNVD